MRGVLKDYYIFVNISFRFTNAMTSRKPQMKSAIQVTLTSASGSPNLREQVTHAKYLKLQIPSERSRAAIASERSQAKHSKRRSQPKDPKRRSQAKDPKRNTPSEDLKRKILSDRFQTNIASERSQAKDSKRKRSQTKGLVRKIPSERSLAEDPKRNIPNESLKIPNKTSLVKGLRPPLNFSKLKQH